MIGYDSESGKDAWKGYRRIIERADTPMLDMLHTFGAEMYKQGHDDALQAAREAVTASSDHYELCICDECCGTAAALAAIDALRECPND